MNLALLSDVLAPVLQAKALAAATSSDDLVLRRIIPFCTRILLCAGRAPAGQPTLPRDLLSVYAFGPLVELCEEYGIGDPERLTVAIQVLGEICEAAPHHVERKAFILLCAADDPDSHLRSIMHQGVTAFEQWQADPRNFRPEDFRDLLAQAAAGSASFGAANQPAPITCAA